MLYLFNSAYFKQYTVNVLNTLHLPDGMENTFQYPEGIVEKDSLKFQKNEEVLIVFIDRYDEQGFKFYPLRKGVLRKIEWSAETAYFKVLLQEYYNEEDIDAFNLTMHKTFASVLPKINEDRNPRSEGTGYFAFKGKDITKENKKQDQWKSIVDQLQHLQAFKDEYMFTKIEIANSLYKYREFAKVRRLLLKCDATYIFNIDYIYKGYEDEKKINIKMINKNLCFNVSNELKPVRNRNGRVTFELNTNKFPERMIEEVNVNIESDTANVVISEAPIKIALTYKKSYLLSFVALLAVITLSNWAMSFDFDLSCFSNSVILSFLHFLGSVKNIILPIINSVIFLILFLKTGRKF